jgi:hypothetical protein
LGGANNITGLIVANNMINPGLGNSISSCANVSIYNNYDLQGNLYTNLNQVASPNGVTRRTVTYSGTGTYTDYASYADKYIGIKGFSGAGLQEVDIMLPLAVGYAGKDIIVMDETGLANGATKKIRIRIRPTSTDKINGITSVSIDAAYTAKTIISDGTTN